MYLSSRQFGRRWHTQGATGSAALPAVSREHQFKSSERLGPRPQSGSRYGNYGPLLIRIVYNLAVAKILPFTEARTHLTELLDEIERVHEHVVITRNGRPSAVVMAQAEYESLIETLEILGDAELMADLAASDEDVAAGRVIPWGKVKRELGLA